MKILVCNKNEKSRLVVGQLLKEMSFSVLLVDSEERLIEEMKSDALDMVFLDIASFSNFPKMLEKIVKNKNESYILLSIDNDDRYSKTEALLNGADDYIYNDFRLEELAAKLKAIVRVLTKKVNNDDSEVLSIYDLTLNPINREVIRGGKEIVLTNKEFLLLEYFLRNKNRVLTRTMISEKIWDIDFITESNIVDVYINFLRAKVDKGFDKKIINSIEDPLIKKIEINIIKPREHDVQINTIMDIMPISTKVLGKIGSGITYTMTGAYVMLTGCDEDGRQMYEFGSSEGILKEQIKLGKAGTPAERDYIIHIDVLIKGGEVYDRRLPNAAFKACDHIVSKIREVLKKQEAKHADEVHEFYDIIRPNAKRVALVKQVAGQGAMYDNLLFPNDPSGFEGGISIIDLGNMPVVLSPNEYRDGILRSLT